MIETSENITGRAGETGTVKAGILNRSIAKVIDFVIVGALLKTVPQIGYFAGLVYLLIGDGLFGGRSVGKRLIGLRVLHIETGQVCGFRESIIRNIVFAVGYFLMMVPLIGFVFPVVIILFESLLIIGNEKGMRFGDEIAGTMAVEESTAVEDSSEDE